MSAVPVRFVLEGVEVGIVDIALTAVAPHRQVAQASQWKKLFTAAADSSRKDKDIQKIHAQMSTIQMVKSKEVDTILQSCGSGYALILVSWIRIRIRIMNADLDPGEQQCPTKIEKSKKI
jgi:hypothetical protein